MSQYLLDTDTLSLIQQGNAIVLQNVNRRVITDIRLSVITIWEQMQGWQGWITSARDRVQLANAHALMVKRLLPTWCRFSVISFSEPAILRFEHLRSLRLNVGPMDLRIGAIALEEGLTVVTRNLRDFGRIPGLTVEDWAI